jgi:hypothetical protein
MPVAKRIIYKPVVKDDGGGGGGSDDDAIFVTVEGQSGDDNNDRTSSERNGSTDEFIFDDDDDDDDDHAPHQVMEMSHGSFDDDFTYHMFGWKDPWLPSVLLTLLIQTPGLLGTIYFAIHVLGVGFAALPFALHLLIRLLTSRYQAHASRKDEILGRFRTRVYGSVVAMYVPYRYDAANQHAPRTHLLSIVLLKLLLRFQHRYCFNGVPVSCHGALSRPFAVDRN